jgi:hypothetical protein
LTFKNGLRVLVMGVLSSFDTVSIFSAQAFQSVYSVAWHDLWLWVTLIVTGAYCLDMGFLLTTQWFGMAQAHLQPSSAAMAPVAPVPVASQAPADDLPLPPYSWSPMP